jgi:tetratricopeptide (TPR) repeat protein
VASSDPAALLGARARFGALAAGDPTDPTLAYWVAVASWRVVPLLRSKQPDRARQICRDGLAAADRALARDPEFADALAIRASLQGLWIAFEPSQMMALGAAMEETMARASTLAPRNPRVQLLRAIHTLHKPDFVGGGAARAQPEFDRAIALYATASAADSALAWGAADASLWAGRCAMTLGDTAAARRHYRRALAIEPGYAWVRDVLLPEARQSSADSAGAR